MQRSILFECAAVIGAGILCVCAVQAQAQTKPPVSINPAMPATATPPTDPNKMAAPASGTPAAGPSVDNSSYILGPEDQISVSMWEEPSFSGSYIIRPDGMISMPLIGEIRAAGRTPLQLQDDVNKAASTLIRTPRSTINLLQSNSKHIYFDGEGISPGAMPMVMPIRLLEAISTRGGLKDFADRKHIRILRDQKTFAIVNYKDLVSGKHPEKNILLQDNDHVVVK